MKKFATAYINFFENSVIAQVFDAENKIEAMKMAIQSNQKKALAKLDKIKKEVIG